MAALSLASPAHRHPRLLERLMEVVRPEFRGDVFHLPRDSKVFFAGICVVPDCPTMLIHTGLGLCRGHYQRWKRDEREAPGAVFDHWLFAEGERTRRAAAPPRACAIAGCERSVKSHSMCHRHVEAWNRHGRPPQPQWMARTLYRPPATSGLGERACAHPACPRWTDGPEMPLCHSHYQSWTHRGRPGLEDWFAELAHGKDPRIGLTRIGRHLRLEVQFGLQCRGDEGAKTARPRTISQAVGIIARAEQEGLASLLDFDDDQWTEFVGGSRAGRSASASTALQFIRDTRLRLHILLVEHDPWADQYPRETWDLRVLGIADENVRYFKFAPITQPWLRDLVKRWTRWRLTQDIVPSTLQINVTSLGICARFLGPAITPETLTRERIEAYLAKLALDFPERATRASHIASLSTFLRDVHRHEWEPRLSPTAWCHDDAPPRTPPRPRWIPEEVMRQMEAPENIARFPSDEGRLIVRILINCGLRLKDARMLPYDCVVHDDHGAPYLAWVNHKMRGRIAFFPIGQALAESIAEQRRRTAERFPEGCKWLFPRFQANLDGARPATSSWFRTQLETWLRQIELVYNDTPTRVTAHQFRHTVATRLINANVPQHVVQQLLDHMSPEMTAVYARLLDKTVREHWERATKLDAEGQVVEIDPAHPLASAKWMRLSMVRAKVTLPNGYCGAPIQTDCEYANPCLDCRFFLTTGEFLDQHRRQRDETRALVADAESAGLRRVVEKNTRTLIKLEKLVAILENFEPHQIVAGGTVEDLDAAS